jgi:hypothetical protein
MTMFQRLESEYLMSIKTKKFGDVDIYKINEYLNGEFFEVMCLSCYKKGTQDFICESGAGISFDKMLKQIKDYVKED